MPSKCSIFSGGDKLRQPGGRSATRGMRGKGMMLPSARRTPCLRCRFSGEPAMARVCGGCLALRQAKASRACESSPSAPLFGHLSQPLPRGPDFSPYRSLHTRKAGSRARPRRPRALCVSAGERWQHPLRRSLPQPLAHALIFPRTGRSILAKPARARVRVVRTHYACPRVSDGSTPCRSLLKPRLPESDRGKLAELFGYLVGVGLDAPHLSRAGRVVN